MISGFCRDHRIKYLKPGIYPVRDTGVDDSVDIEIVYCDLSGYCSVNLAYSRIEKSKGGAIVNT